MKKKLRGAQIKIQNSKAYQCYKKPTPNKWRKIGDTLLTMGTIFSSIAVFNLPDIVTVSAIICTGLGKIITDFATE